MAKWFAGVAELADALDLGSSVPDVQVQVLSPAPNNKGYQYKTVLIPFVLIFSK